MDAWFFRVGSLLQQQGIIKDVCHIIAIMALYVNTRESAMQVALSSGNVQFMTIARNILQYDSLPQSLVMHGIINHANNLKAAKWAMQQAFQCDVSYIRALVITVFGHGKLVLAKWLHQEYTFTEDLVVAAFDAAYKNNHMSTLRWMKQIFDLSVVSLNVVRNIIAALKRGHLYLAEWLACTFVPVVSSYCTRDAILGAIRNGHLAAVKWLFICSRVSAPSLTICEQYMQLAYNMYMIGESPGLCMSTHGVLDIFHMYYDRFMLAACANGHLHIARWLYEIRSHVSQYDWQPSQIGIWGDIIARCCLPILKWLIQTYQIRIATECCNETHEGNHDDCFMYLFTRVCNENELSKARWLADRYASQIEAPFMTRIACIAMNAACQNGHVRIVRWLIIKFQLDRTHMNAYYVEGVNALQRACRGGHLNVVQWLHRRFTLSANDVGEGVPSAYDIVATSDNDELKKWMIDTFGDRDELLESRRVQYEEE